MRTTEIGRWAATTALRCALPRAALAAARDGLGRTGSRWTRPCA